MLRLRLLYGFLMAGLIAGLVACDHFLQEADITSASPGFLIIVLTVGILAGLEFYDLAHRNGARPFVPLGLVLIAACVIAAWWVGWNTSPAFRGRPLTDWQASLLIFAVAVGIGSVFLAQGLRGESQGATFNISATLLGVLYLGVLGGFLMLFRFAVVHSWNVFVFLTIVKWTDIGAYFAGRTMGRHKLICWLSPGKTWEGSLGGLALSTLVAVVFGLFHEPLGWLPVLESVVFAIPVAFIGQLGDLAKSLLKRDAGVKDSSSVIPGFGGVLDVIDSPLMAAPFAYILWILLRAG
jgi:phosphatidate cytidylyltransferase